MKIFAEGGAIFYVSITGVWHVVIRRKHMPIHERKKGLKLDGKLEFQHTLLSQWLALFIQKLLCRTIRSVGEYTLSQ
jgi:hypothetical protein